MNGWTYWMYALVNSVRSVKFGMSKAPLDLRNSISALSKVRGTGLMNSGKYPGGCALEVWDASNCSKLGRQTGCSGSWFVVMLVVPCVVGSKKVDAGISLVVMRRP